MSRKLFFPVWLAAVLGTVLAFPYLLTLQGPQLQSVELPFPLPVLLLISIGQTALFLAIFVGVGLFLAPKVGLELPLLTRRFGGQTEGGIGGDQPGWRSALFTAIGLGIVSASLVILLELVLFLPSLAANGIVLPDSARPPIWQGLLASFYGGITEEVIVRLFLMTLLVWVGHLFTGRAGGQPRPILFWSAILMAALVFGALHLPATAALGLPLNGLVITRGLVLNGIPGLCFGWLYWRYGLEYGMVAHFAADIMLHVVTPLFLQ